MNKEQERIKKLMDSDPLSTAEKITGKDYKTDKDTESLGFFLHIKRGEILNEELRKQDDTTLTVSSKKDYNALFKEYDQITLKRIEHFAEEAKICINNTYPKNKRN